MAVPKKIQGALSMVPPTEEEAVNYNGQMADLMGQLVQTPEQQRKDSLLAWGGGLRDPDGNGSLGGALINATKSESDHRMKDRELRSQYVPLIMNALAAQQQAAQMSRLLAPGGVGGGADGGINFIGMDINQLPRLAQLTGQKISDLHAVWKTANQGDSMPANSYIQLPQAGGGAMKTKFMGDPKTGLGLDPESGQVFNMPGAAQAQAHVAGTVKRSETQAGKSMDFVKAVQPGTNVPYEVPFVNAYPEMFAPPGAVQPGTGPGPTPAPAGGGMSAPGGGMARPPAGIVQVPQGQPAPGQYPGSSEGGRGGNGPGMPPPNGNFRGSFVGNPDKIGEAIMGIADPQERANALAAYENQMRGKNPEYVPDGSEAPVQTPVVNNRPAPGANGLPPGAIQTGADPRVAMAQDTVKEANTSFLKNTFEPALKGAEDARSSLNAVTQSRNALREMGSSGWGTQTKATAAKVLGAMGVENASQYAANYEKFQQAAQLKLWEGLQSQTGPQTEGDANRMRETWASVGNRPEANAFILDMAEAQAQLKLKKAEYFQKALPLAQKQGDLNEIGRRWYKIQPSLYSMPSMKRWNKE